MPMSNLAAKHAHDQMQERQVFGTAIAFTTLLNYTNNKNNAGYQSQTLHKIPNTFQNAMLKTPMKCFPNKQKNASKCFVMQVNVTKETRFLKTEPASLTLTRRIGTNQCSCLASPSRIPSC
jgi:hypothetical protein